ncbi:LEAF RUST 10 DISEASE-RESISTANCEUS RECEPTOR-LIKE PROTEIN KINASE-like 2.5 isoform X3 [Glycine max]|uniref:LEAF RUST 10 DISEASE-RESISTANCEUS RECEPTOR-LIKE PROTEIN KINASE-like 2.5 isoform X3 n=1 Tax=Glycine max TaxID=3847 RepID=UPI000719357A|nr:LEAF RUST 10 DISEASE-RESISTANCE LOCUS RECEPTOR-LIKE PROTEIN KINASE-like 2.5 isoform X3 [Glycine max]|eukprot:XP_006583423.2 LEAF RUST 10 DISEASE-RESISTANCE LOCUS RECEPTOR-LIKE PROTEIN KINASE-like 2.5 isoform X4 [Glycine max]
MFRSLPLFFLFSVTATLLLPSRSDVNFNTSSVLEGKNHSNRGSATATLKIVNKRSKGRHFKVDYVFMACDDRKNCSSSVITRSLGSDGDSGNVARVKLYAVNNSYTRTNKTVNGVVSAVMGGFMICIIICCFRYKLLIQPIKLCSTTKSDQDIEAFLKNKGAVAQKRYKFSEVKKMTNSFKVKLGQGGFGAVYKGQLPTGCPVAVKLLNSSKGNGEEFTNEVASISRTSHVNIVTLLGFCLKGRKKALIYEFMANGSLDKFIYNRGPETIASLRWQNLYQISIGIARGLEYLHRGCNTRILHFDIKPHNILLDENFCPKISDFGLAKLCPRKESIISMSNTRGTLGYVAPEMWNRHFGGVSHKSDVYSYGMMLLEMVGGRKNIDAEASRTSEIYFPHLAYKRLELDNDLRPDEVMTTEENEIAKRMTIVGLWCIQTFPNDRPIMSRVIEMLEGSMNSLEMPPKPMLSSPTRSATESSS